MAEFQTKKKRRNEDWASFAEDLQNLVEKAYPTLQAEAQELLALNQFLSQIGDPQLSFAVRQRVPATVDAAVAAVLELETYLKAPVAPVTKGPETYETDTVASVTPRPLKEDPIQMVIERLDKLEEQLKMWEGGQMTNRQRRDSTKVTCWNCKEEGHISRNCPKKQQSQRKQETPGAVSRAARGKQETPDAVGELPTAPVSSTFQRSNTSDDCILDVHVNGVPASWLVDTGAASTILSKKIWDTLNTERKRLAPLTCNLVDAQGTPLRLDGSAEVELQLGCRQFPVSVLIVESLTTDLILGRDFLKQHKCSVELGENDLPRLTKMGITLPL